MKKIKIGVLGPSNIAFRRTVPALLKSDIFEYVGVAHASMKEWGTTNISSEVLYGEIEKCKQFQTTFGGLVYDSYNSILSNNDIDAIYIPLPPGLHKKWCEEALKYNKHVLLEKPF